MAILQRAQKQVFPKPDMRAFGGQPPGRPDMTAQKNVMPAKPPVGGPDMQISSGPKPMPNQRPDMGIQTSAPVTSAPKPMANQRPNMQAQTAPKPQVQQPQPTQAVQAPGGMMTIQSQPQQAQQPQTQQASNPFNKAIDNYKRSLQLADQTKYDAQTNAFDESKGVAGRVNSLVTSGSPLLETAQTRAAQASNNRGILNSSLGVQAGQQAVIETATPIANADASLYQQTQLANQSAVNSARESNANRTAQLGSLGIQTDESARQANMGDWTTNRKIGLDDTTANRKITVDDENTDAAREQNDKQFAKSLGLEYDKLSAQEKAQLRELSLQRDQLSENTRQFDVTSEQKDRQFADSLDLEYDKLSADEKARLQQDRLERDKLSESGRQFDAGNTTQNRQIDESGRQFDKGLTLDNAKLKESARQFDKNIENSKYLAKLDVESKKALMKLDNQNKLDLMKVEAGYKNEIAGNENISNAWGTMMSGIADIQNNPNLDANTKKTLIKNTINGFRSFTNFWKKSSGGKINVDDLLDFGVSDTSGSKKGDDKKDDGKKDDGKKDDRGKDTDGDGQPDNPGKPEQ